MVFLRQNRVGVAFTMEREQEGDSLTQADAEQYALRELEKAGVPCPCGVVIEAFENPTGWLVFCTADPQAEVYIRFDTADDFLDAVGAFGTGGVTLRGWHTGGYTVSVTGPRTRVAQYAALLGEYGRSFEAPPDYARHLREQAG